MLAPFTVAVFFSILYRVNSTGASFIHGYLFGVGLFGAGVYWVYFSLHLFGGAIAIMSWLGTLVFVLGLALFPACLSILLHQFTRSTNWLLLTAPAVWVLFEWIRSWILTGFPWLSIGYSTLHWPLAGYAPVSYTHLTLPTNREV